MDRQDFRTLLFYSFGGFNNNYFKYTVLLEGQYAD